MAAIVEVQQFALRTTNGTQDILVPDVGEDCRSVVFLISGGLANGTVRNHLKIGIGWVDTAGNAKTPVTCSLEDAQANVDATSSWSETHCIVIHSDNGQALDGQFTFDSYIRDGASSGVRISTTNPPSQAHLVTAIFFFGADVTGVDLTLNPSSLVDVENTINIGQDSDCLFCAHADVNTAVDTVFSHAYQNFGAATWDGTTIRQVGLKMFSQDSKPSGDVRQVMGGTRIGFNFSGGTNISRAMEVTTMDSSLVGITSRGQAAPTDRPYHFLSLNFNGKIPARIEEADVPTSGDLVSAAFGFKPQAVVCAFINTTTHETETGSHVNNADEETCYGAMDGTREFSVAMSDEDGAATTNCTSLTNDSVIIAVDNADTVVMDGDFLSFDTFGVSITMNTNPSAPHAGWILAFGEEVSGDDITSTLVGTAAVAGDLTGIGTIESALVGDADLPDGITGVGTLETSITGTATMPDGISGVGTLTSALVGDADLPDGVTGVGTVASALVGTATLPDGLTGLSNEIESTLAADAALASALTGVGTIESALAGDAALPDGLTGVGTLESSLVATATVPDGVTGIGTLSTAEVGTATLPDGVSGIGTLASAMVGTATVPDGITGAGANEITSALVATATVPDGISGIGTLVSAMVGDAVLPDGLTAASNPDITSSLVATATLPDGVTGIGTVASAMVATATLTSNLTGIGELATPMVGTATTTSNLSGIGSLLSALVGDASLPDNLTAIGSVTTAVVGDAVLAGDLVDGNTLFLGPPLDLSLFARDPDLELSLFARDGDLELSLKAGN